MSTFVISKRSNEEYKYVYASRKGNVIFTSLSFELKFECENAIKLLQGSLLEVQIINKKSSTGKFFFEVLLNQQLCGTSRKFTTLLLLQKGIDGIMKYLDKAEILDFSNQEVVF